MTVTVLSQLINENTETKCCGLMPWIDNIPISNGVMHSGYVFVSKNSFATKIMTLVRKLCIYIAYDRPWSNSFFSKPLDMQGPSLWKTLLVLRCTINSKDMYNVNMCFYIYVCLAIQNELFAGSPGSINTPRE